MIDLVFTLILAGPPASVLAADKTRLPPARVSCRSDLPIFIVTSGKTEAIDGRTLDRDVRDLREIRFGFTKDEPWLIIEQPAGFVPRLRNEKKWGLWKPEVVSDDLTSINVVWRHPHRNVPDVIDCSRRGPGAL